MKLKTISELLDSYKSNNNKIFGEKLIFKGIEGKDVYNITAPFEDDGDLVIAGRVEDRNCEQSKVKFFINRDGVWIPRTNTVEFDLQDPFVTLIDSELIFGGVEIHPHPIIKGASGYKTVFYRGQNINSLKKFTEGPEMMKDIRLVKLINGEIGVFTRPQGEAGKRGKIGFTKIKSLEELNSDVISMTPLLEGQFADDEWGGPNQIHILENGLLGILGHIACFDNEGNRHYYSMVFAYNADTDEASEIKIIAARSDLPRGEAKRPDLEDVIFSGGLVRLKNGKAELYLGASDAEAYKAIIDDPFAEYER
ncbi:MAG TPA: hypothetical protein DEF85_07350 [Clostridiaceae bacterium]|jgi:hypothetical protein|nr:hypothetical protein [Clostridiaceae bacterium]HBG38299.1 hypothetical protein [Clostridiaceae bacterium]HBN28007.1 hypothetical protein [Clostridiaceae bacterium]HBX48690.1 hypothetical protein [Clostridiaceae bacterium]HCL49753.1 hypothetical protein [Clostridiaceae bacterium]